MLDGNEMKYLLASRKKDEFTVDDVSVDLEQLCQSVEYSDAANGEYQVWTYPEGKIYSISPDRKVPPSALFSTPYNESGTLWLPKLQHLSDAPEMIKAAYESFNGEPKNT